MSHAPFVHLHVHTAYSLSEGALRLSALTDLCQRFKMPAVAMTDTGNLFGGLEFSLACSKAGIQPIIGSSLAVDFTTDTQESRRREPRRLVLLAQNDAGYQNLLKLSSISYLDTPPGEMAQVDSATLARHADGLIALTGGPEGPLGPLLDGGQIDAAEAIMRHLLEAFGDRLYAEVQRHGLGREQKIETALVELAYKHDIPLVATNEAYFADAAMFEAHDALLCVAGGNYVTEGDRRQLTPEHRFKSPDEMAMLFKDLPEAIKNTLVIAQRCAVMSPTRGPILPAFSGDADESDILRTQATEGLKDRLEQAVYTATMPAAEREKNAAQYQERLDFELSVIIEMGFAGYFLIVADFIRWAKEHGIPVGPGRGSGAGSVTAWALTITDLDPLRFGLIFERFLNPDRISMPDFDIDFCQDRRDEVIDYVQDKYGRDRVAQIITFGTLQARAALRDVGRVLQLPYGLVDRICKMVPNNPANPVKLSAAIDDEPRLQHMRINEDGVDKLLDVAMKLEGLYRHASTHAAGVVIGDRPLEELVPLYRDPRSDMPVTQFSMKYAEMSGLVKFDFLGLKTLTVIDHAQKLLAEQGIEVAIDAIPLDDERSYEMLQRAESIGVFQFESSGMRDLLHEAVPDNIEDLIALVALYRPGPMENIPKYIACKHGREQPEFLHETIEPVVRDTYGVIIYQEQVMQIAQVFAGYTLGQADLLRRAMGKKIKEEMAAQRAIFVDGAVERGVDKGRAEYVFDLVDKFAGYGFNKAHSAGYALVAYQTAWLKANHPVEFFAASMGLELANTDKLNVFRKEVVRSGIILLPPDINKSGANFKVEQHEGQGAVRYALAAVKNVGKQAMEAVVAEREANGPFKSLLDFAERLDPQHVNKRQLENLARCGAFDSINPNRAQVHAAADLIMRHASLAAEERDSNQSNLFGEMPAEESGLQMPDVAAWREMEVLHQEFEAIGFYLSAHPLDSYGVTLDRLGVTRYADLENRLNGETKRVNLAGSVEGCQERTSARGKKFAFVQLSDATGAFEVTVFSEILDAHRESLEPGQKVLLAIDAKLDEGQIRLTTQGVQSLDDAAALSDVGLEIFLKAEAAKDPTVIEDIRRHLGAAKGRGRVCLHMLLEDQLREVDVDLPGGFKITPEIRAELAHVAGIARLQEI
ncbi:MAG: DNA polymerase III subunit alpha [Alphaproteobacteria bacterium]